VPQAPARWLRYAAAIFILTILPSCGSGKSTGTQASATPDLASVTLASSTVTAGQQVQGTVTLTSAPGSGSVTVNLSSSSTAIATVPASVGVAQGSTTSTFQVTGVNAGSVTVNASLGSTTRQAQLTVNAAAGPVARFVVLQQTNGASIGDTCHVTQENVSGNLMNRLDCTFDGTTSTAQGGVTAYNWTLFNAAGQPAATATGSMWVRPLAPCGSFNGVTSRDVKLSITPTGASSDTTRSIALQKANPC